ncbi:hypothetical protein WMF04_17655 [Sorangium sp. So ce260]|uniref:hypothetical protein n=1 Tax=Sorangium sp. So ce260 TaxID=3133291 RepID=UPI003F63C783
MVESEGTVRSITLEELAAITGALEAGLPRDEVLAGAGLSVEAWEAARERWMSRLAARAARGQLGASQRYLELVAEQKGRAEARARDARRKPEGPVPVAPAAHLSPLQGAPRDQATPLPAAGALVGGEAAARSPWARGGAGAPPGPGLVEPSPLPPAVQSSRPPGISSPPPPAMQSPVPPAMRSAVPAATPAPVPDPPSTAPPGLVTRLDMRAVAPREALPFRQDGSSAPRTESAATAAAERMDATRIGAVSALPADTALPFSRTAPVLPTDKAPPFSRTAPVLPTDKALPFSRTAPVLPTDKALPFSRTAPSPPADNALPFSRPTPSPPADNALPFSRPTPSPPADNALPFSRPTPSPPADNALPFSRPTPSPPADKALPFSRPTSSPPADKALPFSRPTSSGLVKDETAPLPPQRSSGSWALPFQQPSSASGPPTNAPTSGSAARTQSGVDAQEMRRLERLTLGEYARICADVREHPGHVQQIQSHHGLSPQGWAALHAMWHERFRSDPALKARWQALVEQSAQR